MPEYQHNPGKPDKILTGYGSVRGAELKVIYGVVGDMTPLAELEHRFGRPRNGGYETDHIDNCLRFLRTLDMVEQSAQDVLNPFNEDLFPKFELSFEPRLLYHVRQQQGEQYHLADIHDVVIRELNAEGHRYGRRRTSPTELETEMNRNTDYDLTWRQEKILMWTNLLVHLGAISFSSSNDEIVMSPSRALVHELLSHHQQHREDPRSILAALEWIDREFFPVFSRTDGDPAVHVGVADVFENMADDGVLALTGMSDRTAEVDLPRAIDDTRTPSEFEIETAPDRPPYWYPLGRSERRVVT